MSMTDKPKRPRDSNQLAKRVVDIATGEVAETDRTPNDKKDPSAVARGRKGGKIGGRARANRLTAEERREIAQKAAQKRWADC